MLFRIVVLIFSLFVSTHSAVARIAPQVWNRLSPAQRMQLTGAYLHMEESAQATAQKIARTEPAQFTQSCSKPLAGQKTLSIYIGLGYQNGELSITEDQVTFDSVQALLVKKCRETSDKNQMQLCGFSAQKENANFFTKQIKNAAGEIQTVELEIQTSSLTPYDFDNQTRFQEEQNKKSDQAREKYLSALITHDAVFYVGHSRDGGGPDFHPPKLLPQYQNVKEVKGDQVDYTHYTIEPTSINQIIENVQLAATHAKVIGLFSCDSAKHFYENISAVTAPNTLLLSTSRVTEKSMEAMLVGLNGILTGQCDKSLDSLIRPFDGRVLRTKK